MLEASSALRREQRTDEEKRLLRAAIERFPTETELYLRLIAIAGVEEALDRLHNASELLLAERDPHQLTRAAAFALYLLDYESAGRFVRCAEANRTEDFAFGSRLVHIVGRLAAAKGDESVAEEFLTAAFEADPEADGHGYYLARFLLDQGRTRDASQVIDTALRRRSDDARLKQLKLQVPPSI